LDPDPDVLCDVVSALEASTVPHRTRDAVYITSVDQLNDLARQLEQASAVDGRSLVSPMPGLLSQIAVTAPELRQNHVI
jgi:hypothetical protein